MRNVRSLCLMAFAGAFAVACGESAPLPTDLPDRPDLPRPALTPSEQAELASQPAQPTPVMPMPRFSHLSPPGATVIDFEGFGCFTSITNQYAALGVTFSSATILTLPPCLNAAFPPHSGIGVIFDSPTGTITANFSVPVVRAGGYVTGNRVVTLECFDAANVSLGTASTPGPNFLPGGPPNIFLEVVSPGIDRCEFRDGGNTYTVDDFSFVQLIIVDLDIKPGSFPNSINPKSNGVVPVAILGRLDFDVTDVDVTTLDFGPNHALAAHDLTDPATYADHLQDVNLDGLTDLVSHYRQKETGLTPSDTEACLHGATLGGTPIEGCDSVRVLDK